MATNRFQKAAEHRQEVLNYLIEHPGATSPEVATALGQSRNTMANWILEMATAGEIRREPIILNLKGSGHHSYKCYAAVTETAAWETMAKKAHATVASYAPEFRDDKRPNKTKKPWLTTNTDPNRPPIKGQGGQGAVRRSGWARAEEPGWT